MTAAERAFFRAARKLSEQARKLVMDELGSAITPQRRAQVVHLLQSGAPCRVTIQLTAPPSVVITCGDELVGAALSKPETLQ